MLITAIGVSAESRMVMLSFVFGVSPGDMPPPLSDRLPRHFRSGEEFAAAGDRMVDVVIFATATSLMLIMQYLVFHTKLGVAMRAVSFNTDTAALMGIPVDRRIVYVCADRCYRSRVSDRDEVSKHQSAVYMIWVLLGLKAFVAAVYWWHRECLRGAVLGGFVIAFVEKVWRSAFRPTTEMSTSSLLLILILLVKPSGLLGSTLREKV
ncbi:MAG: hypothetical protein U0936_20875 [Planctomycetaceae bacterium]